MIPKEKALHTAPYMECTDQVCALVRALKQGDPESPCSAHIGHLTVALAMVAGADKAGPYLASIMPWDDVPGFLKAMMKKGKQAQELPRAQPSPDLEKILTGRLRPWFEGQLSPEEGLKLLLSGQHARQAARAYVAKAVEAAVPALSRARMLSRLVGFYLERYLIARKRYLIAHNGKLPGFVASPNESKFRESCRNLARTEERMQEVFKSPVYLKSPLGICYRKHGQLDAHVLGAVTARDLSPGEFDPGPLSVLEITYVLSPDLHIRALPKAFDAIRHLQDDGLIELYGAETSLGYGIHDRVSTSEPFLRECAEYCSVPHVSQGSIASLLKEKVK